jgi:hypothetical protein
VSDYFFSKTISIDKQLEFVNFIKVPRLEWEDRKFEQNNFATDNVNKLPEANIPARVLVSGGYSQGIGGIEPFVGLVQLQRKPV